MKLSSGIAITCLAALVVIAAVLIFDVGRKAPAGYLAVSSFDDCVQAGYPVLESYPRQCATPDGKSFAEIASASTTPAIMSSAPRATPTGTAATSSLVTLSNIKANSAISNPVPISGVAPGTWFFEAELLVNVADANGTVLGSSAGHASGDWMTAKPVAFDAVLSFSTSTTRTGTIVIHKDNPSGDPSKDQSVSIPITFSHYIQ